MSLALIISKLEGFVTDPGSVAPDPDSDSSAESSSDESEDVDLEDLTGECVVVYDASMTTRTCQGVLFDAFAVDVDPGMQVAVDLIKEIKDHLKDALDGPLLSIIKTFFKDRGGEICVYHGGAKRLQRLRRLAIALEKGLSSRRDFLINFSRNLLLKTSFITTVFFPLYLFPSSLNLQVSPPLHPLSRSEPSLTVPPMAFLPMVRRIEAVPVFSPLFPVPGSSCFPLPGPRRGFSTIMFVVGSEVVAAFADPYSASS